MQWMTILTFLGFTGLVAFLTLWMTRRDDHTSASGYFLGGRSLTAGFIAGSLMLTNLSTEQLVGLNGAAFKDGLSVMAWEVIAVLALVLMALFFLPRFLKSGITTIPEFLEKRFDTGTRVITTLIFVVAYAGILLPIILYTGATGLNGMLDISGLTGIESETALLWVTVWLVGMIGSLYAIFGGLRTVAVSDTLNGFGLLLGGILITVYGLDAVSEGGILDGWRVMREAHPERFNSIGGEDQSVPFSTLFTGVLLLNLFYWCTNQQIIQRTFGAKNLAEGQKGVLLAGGLKLLAPLILVVPGMIAFYLYSQEGISPVAGITADQAYGHLVREVLPAPLVGFFAAVMVGAILSSFNSALNSVSTLFSLGIYQKLIRPGSSDEEAVRVSKRFGWGVALIAMTVAPMLAGQDSIFKYLQKMNGLYFIPIFSVVVVGILFRKVPAVAAKAALLLGFTVIALGYFVPSLAPHVEALNEFHFLGVVFGALVLMMLLLGAVMPREEAWEQMYSKDVDITPWRHSRTAGAILVALVLAIYMVFAGQTSPVKAVTPGPDLSKEAVLNILRANASEPLDERDLCLEPVEGFSDFVVEGAFASDRGCIAVNVWQSRAGAAPLKLSTEAAAAAVFRSRNWANLTREQKAEMAKRWTLEGEMLYGGSVLERKPDEHFSDDIFHAPEVRWTDEGKLTVTFWQREPSGMRCGSGYVRVRFEYTESGARSGFDRLQGFFVPCERVPQPTPTP